jgi:Tfp pilus assembly protein PilX
MKAYPCKAILRPMNNQSGSAIVFALLILVVVTLLGLSASQTSTVEYQIANNDQLQHIAFHNADSGVWGTAKLISNAVNDGAAQLSGAGNPAPGITYSSTAQNFYQQVTDFDPYDGGAKDVNFAPSGVTATVDARRMGQGPVAGGGAEFASGSEGIGVTTVAIYFDLVSDGSAPRSAVDQVDAIYRKLVGVPGGL